MIPVSSNYQSKPHTLRTHAFNVITFTLLISAFSILTTGILVTNFMEKAASAQQKIHDDYHKYSEFVCDVEVSFKLTYLHISPFY